MGAPAAAEGEPHPLCISSAIIIDLRFPQGVGIHLC